MKEEEGVEFEIDDGDVCDLFQKHAAVSLTTAEVQRLEQRHASYHAVPDSTAKVEVSRVHALGVSSV